MTTTPPGWYDDGHGATRWWDGVRWTEHAQPATPQVAAPAPRKSKLWILWLGLGVVALGAVVAALFAIPALIGVFAGGSSVAASSDEERAALAAVELHDDAWHGADCALYEEATTEYFRSTGGFEECEDFLTEAAFFINTTENYELVVTGIRRDGEAIVITTDESFDALTDENGEPLDEPEPTVYEYAYVVVDDGGTWRVDAWE